MSALPRQSNPRKEGSKSLLITRLGLPTKQCPILHVQKIPAHLANRVAPLAICHSTQTKGLTTSGGGHQDAKPITEPTVLIADDDDDTRVMFRTLLGTKGYRVVEASDGEEVIEVTLRENPGLVLLDLGLPLMNGLNVIRRLRNDLHVIDIPVVVITGYDKHFDTAVAAGCDDYLIKPIDFGRLDSILNYYVPLRANTAIA